MIHTFVLTDVFPEAMIAAMDKRVLETAIQDIMAGARSKWIQLAGERLNSSRRDYINAIQEVHVEGTTASIELVGVLPNMVENGADAFDMHDTLLKGPGVRTSASGNRYRSIPFRHQTPGTAGQGGGTPMGRAYEGHPAVKDAQELGRTIYTYGKKLAATIGEPGGGVKYGDRLQAGLAPKLKEKHSTDIYAGMIREQKTYKSATQSQYITFRTISDAVPDKWQHPGIQAANLGQEVEDFVQKIAPMALGALFNA